MIKLQVIGNLGRDSVVNNVNGKSVINFVVAHSEKIRNAQGVQTDKTIWVDCAYWTDKTAIAPYLKKGTQVYVEGQPDIRNYTTKEGVAGSSLTLRVFSVQLLGGKPDHQGGEQNSSQSQPSQSAENSINQPQTNTMSNTPQEQLDDLPF